MYWISLLAGKGLFIFYSMKFNSRTIWKQNYLEELKDARWKVKREIILERDQYKCSECGAKGIQLFVHHLRYGPTAWDIPDDQLITLCRKCHTGKHFE